MRPLLSKPSSSTSSSRSNHKHLYWWFGSLIFLLLVFSIGLFIGRRVSNNGNGGNNNLLRISSSIDNIHSTKIENLNIIDSYNLETKLLVIEIKNAEATLQHARDFMKKLHDDQQQQRKPSSSKSVSESTIITPSSSTTKSNPNQQQQQLLIQPSTSSSNKSNLPPLPDSTALIIFCYNRPDYLSRTLKSIQSRLQSDPVVETMFKAKNSASASGGGGLKIIISQDEASQFSSVAQIAQQWVSEMTKLGYFVQYWPQTRNKVIQQQPVAYYALAQHYGKGLTRIFKEFSDVGRVIILEDDLELAVDFFSWMGAGASLLESDTSLLAISAWNDHGRPQFASDAKTIVRADFFPGLGWMIPKRLWKELEPKWPDSYWDDWLREPAQRRNRQVLRPEVTRTVTFGSSGSSMGQFYMQYLAPMQLNIEYVDFTKDVDLSYLIPPEKYKLEFFHRVYEKSQVVYSVQEIHEYVEKTNDNSGGNNNNVRIEYDTLQQYERIAAELGIINDVKAGVPRGAYEGIVPLRMKGKMVYIAPKHRGNNNIMDH
jgi:alpha-1,3-mannosyl-glycoprotein beta-1,2-N-acetylglucosaminyltransferase